VFASLKHNLNPEIVFVNKKIMINMI